MWKLRVCAEDHLGLEWGRGTIWMDTPYQEYRVAGRQTNGWKALQPDEQSCERREMSWCRGLTPSEPEREQGDKAGHAWLSATKVRGGKYVETRESN